MKQEENDFDLLLASWRTAINTYPPADEFSRAAGFFSALTTCAAQLEETLIRMRKDTGE